MKNFWKPCIVGMFVLSASPSTQADNTAPGSYSDRQLTQQTQPPYPKADPGNDLLLAENVGAGGPPTYPYNVTVDPTSWKTAFFVGETDGRGGFKNNPDGTTSAADVTGKTGFSFTGTGPTGTYPNAGTGKHTQNTKVLLNKVVVVSGNTWAYQYVVTATTHSWYNDGGSDTKYSLGVNTYSF